MYVLRVSFSKLSLSPWNTYLYYLHMYVCLDTDPSPLTPEILQMKDWRYMYM